MSSTSSPGLCSPVNPCSSAMARACFIARRFLSLCFSSRTKERILPTFSWLCSAKLKPNFFAERSYIRQSSRDFLLILTFAAASSRVSFTMLPSAFSYPVYKRRHRLTDEMTSEMVRSLILDWRPHMSTPSAVILFVSYHRLVTLLAYSLYCGKQERKLIESLLLKSV